MIRRVLVSHTHTHDETQNEINCIIVICVDSDVIKPRTVLRTEQKEQFLMKTLLDAFYQLCWKHCAKCELEIQTKRGMLGNRNITIQPCAAKSAR